MPSFSLRSSFLSDRQTTYSKTFNSIRFNQLWAVSCELWAVSWSLIFSNSRWTRSASSVRVRVLVWGFYYLVANNKGNQESRIKNSDDNDDGLGQGIKLQLSMKKASIHGLLITPFPSSLPGIVLLHSLIPVFLFPGTTPHHTTQLPSPSMKNRFVS